MNINYIKILSGIVILFISGICMGDNIIYTDPAKAITVTKSNPKITIVLKSNSSTGFSWDLKTYDQSLFSMKSHKYTSAPGCCGRPGYETWKFDVNPKAFTTKHNVNAKITLTYSRSWEKIPGKDITFNIVINNSDDATASANTILPNAIDDIDD
jgi:predicted secreted protein